MQKRWIPGIVLFAVLLVASNASCSGREINTYAVSLLRAAEKSATKEPVNYRRADALQQIGTAWIRIDKKQAVRCLNEAWRISGKISDVNDRHTVQGSIIEQGWAGVDPAKARYLAAHFPDEYWRNSLCSDLPKDVAQFNPVQGIYMLNAIKNPQTREDQTAYAVQEIARVDPISAIRFIKKVKNINHDVVITGVISDLADDNYKTAESLLVYLQSREEIDRSLGLIVDAICLVKPDEALRLARRIQGAETKSQSLARISDAMVSRNPALARKLAKESVVAAKKVQDPSDRKSLFVSIAYLVSQADVESAREMLEEPTLTAKSERRGMWAWRMTDLAGAWAFVDIQKAESFYQEAVRLDPSHMIKAEDLGGYFAESLGWYLAGVALIDTQRAVNLTREYAKQVHSPDTNVMEYVIKPLAKRDREQSLAFALAFGGDSLKNELKQKFLAEQILADPQHGEALIPQLIDSDIGNERDTVAVSVAVSLSSRNLPAAKRIIGCMTHPCSKIEVWRKIGKQYLKEGRPEALSMFKQAAIIAHKQKPALAATELTEIAEAILPGPRF